MKKSILLSAAVFALLGFQIQAAKDDIFLDESYKSGLVNLSNGDDMFYWLFNSRQDPTNDPVVMWLTGGPGCASEIAIFYENGPYTINDDMTLNPHA